MFRSRLRARRPATVRIARVVVGDAARYGMVTEDSIELFPLDTVAGWSPEAAAATAGSVPLEEVELLAPVGPSKIIAVGLNYRDHAEEQDLDIPSEPLLFAKFPSSIVGPDHPIERPSTVEQLDYEAELGVVIGKECRHVSDDQAEDAIGGYVIVNDVSARDMQFADGQWVRGKSLNTFAPMGPYLVTADEIGDPHDLDISLTLNGEIMQLSNTSNLIFGVNRLVSYCSRFFTLHAGDVISTGTPGGVGVFRDPPVFMSGGDVVEVTISGLGRLRNPVVDVA